ncbi:flagellar hook-basal body complex protein FliE [Erythrobacter sp. HL-111]|uniref:flagellar hook-basal body complex protein FliE n=1 Tax=Erythrobacter sp. HL-111 TaxID=1798193 RepID=UPI0006DAF151|nr:flagellar hook-basal body complex protein FliE [Erythrobacter sp. HL-111]KPP92577.1 MAG: flagellar hook-basal body complex protein FliE [Erythrobacteraceae bacterium HL-111]SDS92795.1 flagellar hook-basal body complex protein FliE [Erythrobacter sp. HL-111]
MSPVRSGGGVQAGLADVLALRREVLARSEALREVREASASPAAAPARGQGEAPAAGFAETLGHALEKVSAAQQRSAEMQAAYERGEVTDVAKVMLARQESGVAFEATLQVRNKLLSAYQEIMRMGS